MAAKSQHPPISSRDANMNALAHPDTYSSFGYLAHASRNNHSSNMKRQKDGQIKAPPGLPVSWQVVGTPRPVDYYYLWVIWAVEIQSCRRYVQFTRDSSTLCCLYRHDRCALVSPI